MSSVALFGAATLALSACGGDPLESDAGGESVAAETIAIGSANFPESELLAEMYAQVLESEGIDVERNFNIGARDLYLAALEDGSIDLLPEYNGALYSSLVEGGAPEGVTEPDEVYDAMVEVLPEGIVALEQSEAEDKDTLAVLPETAEEYNLETMDDLTDIAGELTLAAGPEFVERFQGLIGLEEVYGIVFSEFRPLDAGGPLTREALLSGEVDVANIFSTDSTIETESLVVLEDTQNLFLSENIVPIIRESKVDDTVTESLNAVSAALTTENLTEYLARVQVDKESSATVATAFLEEYDLL
ncbi:osmoprotectant transport system substrate-binding protein [Arthrobacter sp. CAN_A212]|uniref:ABC transporter substrate-binding protein n=1 Tax=unclassified Arthrobacter TaxID=235627 RepID=UPI001A24E99A|nr:ABC transporter substrate-binding protein [Arthrobacter sp. CAN_C5]MBP2216263.1 osmoprotectant transport system substrate-binding protein [Arthrobacter sp. CAN_C5]